MSGGGGGARPGLATKCGACRVNHQQTPPLPLPLQGAHGLHKGGGCAPRAGRCLPREWQQGREQPTAHGTVHVVRRCEKSLYGGAGGWDRRGCATGAPRSATRQGEEQHRHTERGSHTRQRGGAQRGRRGNQNSGNREPEWSGWESVRMGGSDNKGDGLASQPRRYRVPGQPLLNRHQVGVSPAAQMGCLRNRSGSPSGAYQP